MTKDMENNTNDRARRFSSFDRADRLEQFKTNDYAEEVIDLLNKDLSSVESFLMSTNSQSIFPPIIITGVPRSGTTLINQMLPARFDLGYVSNLMARFHRAPLTGAWLQKQLMTNDIHQLRNFQSKHGVTNKIFEPHEFGYFWGRHLNFGGDSHEPTRSAEIKTLNFHALNSELNGICSIYDSPSVFKCAIAPFMLTELLRNTNIFVLHITRDRASTVNSILNAREERLGDKKKWWSIRPHGWANQLEKSPNDQVCWQYDKTISAVRSGGELFPDRVLEINLSDLISEPEKTLETIGTAYNNYSEYNFHKVGVEISADN
jgi:hypothetical protein